MILFLRTLFLFCLTTPALLANETPVTAKLLAEVHSIKPGEAFSVGLSLTMEPGWHTYYKKAGESGLPTTIEWHLPEGFKASRLEWPKPEIFDFEDITSNGYTNHVVLLTKISPPEDLELNKPIQLAATVNWLACNDLCIPGEAELSITLPVQEGKPTQNLDNQALFNITRASRSNTITIPLDSSPLLEKEKKTLFNKALLFAFIGGLALNLMPCIFPVLSLKIIGFVKQAGAHPWKVRIHGIVFTFGVLASFLALSGLLILLRTGGTELGWGFQLQSPYFIAFLSGLLVLVALNFSGVFEIGTSMISTGSRFGRKSGLIGTFSSGVLATVLATPCTAPFMGTALGYALAQPTINALSIFGALGMGMATPYLILSFAPGLLNSLPKPGIWMEHFKQAMAFPMLATVLWLLWVFSKQTGPDPLFDLLLALLLLAVAAWIYGRFAGFGASIKTKRKGRLFSLIFLALGALLAYNAGKNPSQMDDESYMKSFTWENFSPERVEALKAEGRPIYIDFTAAWCLTCQVNKKNVFRSKEVINTLKKKGVVMLKADWTKHDAVITHALQGYGRSGVPTNILYTGDSKTDPVILPELLSPGIVLDALSKIDAAKSSQSATVKE